MSFFGNSDFYTEVAKGNVDGHATVLMQGFNPNVDLAAAENLWDLEGIFIYPAAGEQWEVVSSDANDAAAGTGAQQVTIEYLDDTYTEQEETVILNGTTPVNFVATDAFRPVKAKVIAVGSGGENAGLITVRVTGGGAERIGIIAGGNRSLHGFYTVPADKEAYLISAYATIQKGKDADISVFNTDGVNGIFFKQIPVNIYQNSIVLSTKSPIGPLPEKTDVKFECLTENNNTGVNATLQLLVVDKVTP